MADVRDILEIEGTPQTVASKNAIIHGSKQVFSFHHLLALLLGSVHI